jgi:integrase
VRGEGKLYRYPDSRFWWMQYFHRGKKYCESTGQTDEKKAKKKLRDKIAELTLDRTGKFAFVPNNTLKVSDMLDALESDYKLHNVKGIAQIKSHIKPVREFMGSYRASEVSPELVDSYIQSRLRGNGKQAVRARGTVNRETTMLRRAFKLAVDRRKLPLSAIPSIRRLSETGRREGFFEAAEFKALMDRLPEYLKAFTKFGYLSGWRRGEIRSLEWHQVDMHGRVLRLRPEQSKNKRGRNLVLAGELWDLIQEQHHKRRYENPDRTTSLSRFVFHHKGEPIGDTRKAWATACEKAGVVGRLFHDLRRTRARDMRRAGVPEDVCMAVLGHRTRSIFTRYDIVDERDQHNALIQTQDYLSSVQEKAR